MSDKSLPDKSPLRHLPLIAIAIVAVLGALLLRDTLSVETLRTHRETLIAYRDAHYLVAVLVFMALYVLIVTFSLPGGLVATLTGGFLFGTWPGVLYNVVAATAGATLIFLAARWGLGERLAARMDESEGRIRALKDALDANQWPVLFLIRLIPAVPFFVANLLPALVGVPLRRYVISTFFGIMPGALVYTSVGAGLGAVFEAGGTPDVGIFFAPQVLLPILGLCALAALPLLLKPLRRGKGL
ncbi:TVP38/TMEM64 family protein [Pseudooceanicola sp.]|uniref:TVP38/TMEM64 family protein n=1 Tax=Pseudooceanicola sp. TaxID=1914328 RepID=UPI003517620C